ncbi:hypothetical protein PS662_06045 [Pseudomonas fluorescens]|uniref:Uncharacterized protein n=1 Tax=Pseudomonas fluorescens TaxID=294 RepID=A0A5E6Y6P7_PSEFL|nr:hypothetical protein PS662_06045 [Pseudomonas fluorescens]
MRDQTLQTLAARGGQVVGQRQGQAEIQARERRAQFVGNGVEQIALLVEQVLDVAGHGVKDVGQAADVGVRGDFGALAQVPPAEAFCRAFETFQVAPVRAQPQQQAREHGRADQHVDAPVQQIDVQRVRRHDHLHHGLRVQRRHRQRVAAPVADAHNVFAALQTLLFVRGQAGVVIAAENDMQRVERLVQLNRQRRPLRFGHGVKLFDDKVPQTPGVIEIVGGEPLVEDSDHHVRHQVNGRAVGDDRHQVQAEEDPEHDLSIPTRNG